MPLPKKDWRWLLGNLIIRSPVGGTIARPDEAALKQWEAKRKMKLPPSYRAFAKTIGAGEIGGFFRIYVPGQGRGMGDLTAFQARISKTKDVLLEVLEDPDLINGMVPFADSFGGDMIVWYDPRKKKDDEPPVWMIHRGNDPPLQIARNFTDFINSVCLGRRAAKVLGDPAWKRELTFLPYGRTRRVRV